MHEVGVMQEAVEMAIETARKQGGSHIHRLKLSVGTISGIVPEALQFAFDMVCLGTMAEGAVLEIEKVNPTCWCNQCEAEFECIDYHMECPKCQNIGSGLRGGRDMNLTSVEIS